MFVPFLLSRLLLLPLALVRRRARQGTAQSALLCIEAGVRGWQSIEFKELYAAACEYLGEDAVRRVEIQPDLGYVRQVGSAVRRHRPTHYVYDARSGSQRSWTGLWQAFRVAWLLRARGVTPIVLLADLSLRQHRAQSAVVTAARGVVVAFMSARAARPIFPHDRLIGPSLMPFSVSTLHAIRMLRASRPASLPARAAFIGLLYEPRETILNDVAARLSSRGVELTVRGRRPGMPRIPDDEYWATLINNPVVFTTAEQIVTPQSDWPWITQMTYRYLEATLCGSLLVAPDVPGVQRFFRAGEHFVSYDSPAEAAAKIEYYLRNDAERRAISERACERAEALVLARTFWTGIDAALGPDALT